MSLPDRNLTLIEALRYYKSGELTELAAEDCIKAIMLELVGEDRRLTGAVAPDSMQERINNVYLVGQNELRAKLRTKINEL